MKRLFSLPNIYVFLWALYYTQGTIIPKGSIWSRSILVLFLLISVYFMCVTFSRHRKGPYLRSLGILIFMFSIYGVIHAINNGDATYLQMVYLSLLPIYTFFVLTIKRQINDRWIRYVFWIMLGVVVIQYVSFVSYMEETLQDADNATINVGYDIVALLPLVFFWKNKPVLQFIIWAVVIALVISTVKRGAIIVAILCTMYFIYNTIKYSKRKTKWYIWLLVLIFLAVGVRYVVSFYFSSDFAQVRLENTLAGESSGRDSIYREAWSVFLNSDLLGIIFGHGASATVNQIGIAAHNDWLEILVNQGLLGVLVYLIYWITLFNAFKRDKSIKLRPVLGTVIIIYFMATLFSMSYSAMTLPSTLALGYCLAEQQKRKSSTDSMVDYV